MVCRLLKSPASLRQLDAVEDGATPLALAVAGGHFEAAEALLLHGADLEGGDGRAGLRPPNLLHVAAARQVTCAVG